MADKTAGIDMVSRKYTTVALCMQLLPPPRSMCSHRCFSVCLLATMCKNFRTDFMKFSGRLAMKQMIKFWWRSGSPFGYSNCFPDLSHNKWLTDINLLLISELLIRQRAALVRRALAEVWTVPVLLVNYWYWCYCCVFYCGLDVVFLSLTFTSLRK